MQEAGLEEVEAYILRRQNKIVQYITTRPIMDLCKEVVRRLGMWVTKRWREQEGLDLGGARKMVVAADEEGTEDTEG